ncbi:hypothetical protein C357_00744 [Citreicella sp. 357]|nr:hypothetical protein C357_00744 [Citreicella sp. 357]
MRKSRFTKAQIIGIIKEQEAGMPTAKVCRRHGLSTATFYKLKAKYGGMEVSEAARLKALEDVAGNGRAAPGRRCRLPPVATRVGHWISCPTASAPRGRSESSP